jgi:hypothetical protein
MPKKHKKFLNPTLSFHISLIYLLFIYLLLGRLGRGGAHLRGVEKKQEF